ncbi:MAG: hypothetical protein ACLQHA_03880, partial [Thermoplasmata archaeon]
EIGLANGICLFEFSQQVSGFTRIPCTDLPDEIREEEADFIEAISRDSLGSESRIGRWTSAAKPDGNLRVRHEPGKNARLCRTYTFRHLVEFL